MPSPPATAPWFERRFEFHVPVEHYPNLCSRLRGTAARLEEISHRPRLTVKPGEKWSAQEHAGHLLDMEPLWLARVEDFLSSGDTLSPADLTNRKTDEAHHNAAPIAHILAEFRTARSALLDRVEQLNPKEISRTLIHPRLQQPMRLIDHLYFIAEHDDHHLAAIWQLTE